MEKIDIYALYSNKKYVYLSQVKTDVTIVNTLKKE